MPLEFCRTFRIRHYECDAFGHVNHANYLRFMQETALDASAAVGFDVQWYRRHNRAWIIRETDITYLRPLVYGDVVAIRTWVDHFDHIRSRRAYHLALAGSGEPIAQAHTDWVYMNLETDRPEVVPPEMAAAFAAPQLRIERQHFPKAPPAPAGTFTMRQAVTWHDLDTQQHVNNANYVTYLEECSMRVGSAFGWPAQRMLKEGFAIVARRYHIQYKQPARLGDVLLIGTWASGVRRATATRHYQISRAPDGPLLARANVLWVWVDLQTGHPIRIPEQFRSDFAPNIAP